MTIACADTAKRSRDQGGVSSAQRKVIPAIIPTRAIKAQQSKVTNGTVLLRGIDQRNPFVRRAKDLIRAHISDMGGESNLSASEMSSIRRAVTLTILCETLETKFAKAENVDAASPDYDLYGRLCGYLARMVDRLGLKRRARPVGQPSLSDYLEGSAQVEQPGVDEVDAVDEDVSAGDEAFVDQAVAEIAATDDNTSS